MKKAASPLISVILILVFVVAISTAILGWLTTYTKTSTDAASSGTSGTSGVVNCANQIITINDVYINSDHAAITQFNDTNTSDIFVSLSGGTYIKYVKVPKNKTLTSAKITITGQPY